jgi:hypothetical protein
MGIASTAPGIHNLTNTWRRQLHAPATVPSEKLPAVSIEQEGEPVPDLVRMVYEIKEQLTPDENQL